MSDSRIEAPCNGGDASQGGGPSRQDGAVLKRRRRKTPKYLSNLKRKRFLDFRRGGGENLQASVETQGPRPMVSAMVAEALQSENQRLQKLMEDLKGQWIDWPGKTRPFRKKPRRLRCLRSPAGRRDGRTGGNPGG